MLDLHFSHLIKNGFKYFLADKQHIFYPAFSMVGDKMKDRMFDKLTSNEIYIDYANIKKVEQLPLITIQMFEQQYKFSSLGDLGFKQEYEDSGVVYDTKHLALRQDVKLNIFATDLDSLRGICHLIHCIVILFKKELLKIGYLDIVFLESSPVNLSTELISEGNAIYARTMTFSSIYNMSLLDRIEDLTDIGAVPPNLPIKIFDEQSAIDLGYPFGVKTDEEI